MVPPAAVAAAPSTVGIPAPTAPAAPRDALAATEEAIVAFATAVHAMDPSIPPSAPATNTLDM